MRISAERLDRLASETGFRSDTLERVVRLGELLGDFRGHPLLSRTLVLKGGTALNLCFGDPKRLSVDLDLNYVGSVNREVMVRERPEIERAIERVAAARGYQAQRSRDAHAGRKVFLGYRNARGAPGRIAVDVNFMFRLPLADPEERRCWQPGDLERPAIRAVGVEELAAGKLTALLDRAAPRDLYDVRRLPGIVGASWGSRRLKRLFVGFAGMLKLPLHRYGHERMDRVTDAVVREQLYPMLLRGDEPGAAELREWAWKVTQPMLLLDEQERQYTERLQRGELSPELLFPEDEVMAGRFRQHPVLRWKAENARAFVAGAAGRRMDRLPSPFGPGGRPGPER